MRQLDDFMPSDHRLRSIREMVNRRFGRKIVWHLRKVTGA